MLGPLQGALTLYCLLGSMSSSGCYGECEMSLPPSAASGSIQSTKGACSFITALWLGNKVLNWNF